MTGGLPLDGDVNVGCDKHLVENSELANLKEELEARLEKLVSRCTQRQFVADGHPLCFGVCPKLGEI